MGWLTIDDFESGSLSGDWSGNNSFVITSIDPLEGTYSVAIDTDQTEFAPNVRLTLVNTTNVSRNSSDEKTVRSLFAGDVDPNPNKGIGLMFFFTDSDNYYVIRLSHGKENGNSITLSKIVSGVTTILANHAFSDAGATTISGIEIKAETNLITVFSYTDTSFSVSTGIELTTSDTTYTSGEIGFELDSMSSPSQGVKGYRLDYIQHYAEATGAEISKVKIAGTFVEKPAMVKIGGTFVEKIMKVRVGGVFQ